MAGKALVFLDLYSEKSSIGIEGRMISKYGSWPFSADLENIFSSFLQAKGKNISERSSPFDLLLSIFFSLSEFFTASTINLDIIKKSAF
jgi:hypothetical protein